MSDKAVFEGGCLCGAIRYRATQGPLRGVICHCTMCRRHSGAPALAFVHFAAHAFRWIGEEPARYRSSERAERGFCPRCGSTLTMHEEELTDRVQVCVGRANALSFVSCVSATVAVGAAIDRAESTVTRNV